MSALGRGFALLVLAGAAPVEAEGFRGTFGQADRESISVVDAFAWSEPGPDGDGERLRLRLTDHTLNRPALDLAMDVESELDRQRDGGAFAELELDPATGAWLDTRFQLPDGAGCGGCGEAEQRALARIRLVDGRLLGRIDIGGKSTTDPFALEIDLVLDLPIVRPAVTERLPADGGAPGRAIDACRLALRRGDRAGTRLLCLAPDDPTLAAVEKTDDDRFFEALLTNRDALRAGALSISGGRLRGDRAELEVETGGVEGKQLGRVQLRRTSAGWRYQSERLHPVWTEPPPQPPSPPSGG